MTTPVDRLLVEISPRRRYHLTWWLPRNRVYVRDAQRLGYIRALRNGLLAMTWRGVARRRAVIEGRV